MPAATPVHGSKGAVYMSSSAAGTPTLIMKVTDFTLDMTTDKVETTGLQDLNKTYLPGQKDIQGTLSAYWLADDETLFDAADSPDGMMLYLYPNLPSGYWWGGPAWLDVSIKVSVSDVVKVDGNFSANGAWTRSGAEVTAMALDAMSLRLAGASARLCWGYQTVAELGAWSIADGSLVAQSVKVLNPIWLTQRDLKLVIPRGDGRPPWTRTLSHVVVVNDVLSAHLVRASLEVTA